LKYQGVAPPAGRSEADFDPGAKYHVPANVPYMRYFLARIYQFQFQRALCKETGYQGQLHRCLIYGNKTAGENLNAMLELDRSKPWPDALETLRARNKWTPQLSPTISRRSKLGSTTKTERITIRWAGRPLVS
jgi:peptidyl-dipeptidase A